MVLADGKQKGMRCVLEERGVDFTGMNAACMREKLKTLSDFKCFFSIVQEVVEGRNHICMFLPRFHCELNPIERCWCHAKKFTRAHCNGSIIRLRKIVPEGLATVNKDLIARFLRSTGIQ